MKVAATLSVGDRVRWSYQVIEACSGQRRGMVDERGTVEKVGYSDTGSKVHAEYLVRWDNGRGRGYQPEGNVERA